MHPLVRNLYRRLLVVGRDYPPGLDHVRTRAKAKFLANAHITDELELRKAVHYGRHMVKEMQGIIKLKKYRALRERYADS